MQDIGQQAALVVGLAFALAFVFGAVAHRVSFCTMGAITDIVTFGDWRRMRMWLLAIAVAIAGRGALQVAGPDRPARRRSTPAPRCPGCRTWSADFCSASA